MNEYGPVFKVSIPPNINGLVICDPHIAAQVLACHSPRYVHMYASDVMFIQCMHQRINICLAPSENE